jgi:ADP-ribosylglycohydrolase
MPFEGRSAVAGGGDTGTTAAISGALSEAHDGVSGLPQYLVEDVEDSVGLQQLGRDIYRLTGRSER